MRPGIAVTALASVSTIALTPLSARLLRRFGVMDIPNSRSSHARPTVRGGGCAPLAGAAIALTVVAPGPGSLRALLRGVAIGLGGLGFVDDVRPLPPAIRLAATVGIAALPIGLAMEAPLGVALGMGAGLAALVVTAYVNAFNFMDGIDGISALQTIVVGAVLSAGGALADVEILVVAGLAIAAAAAGFLPYNFPTAGVFLGDVGSYGIGGWLGVLGVIAATEVSPVLPASLAAVYGADTAATVVRRLRRGDRIWVSHREHSYQRLCRAGWSHAASAAWVTGCTGICGVLGLAAARRGVGAGIAGLTAVAVVCAGYLRLPGIVERRAALRHQVSAG